MKKEILIEMKCDRDLLSQHCSLIKDMSEFEAPQQEGNIELKSGIPLVGVKSNTFSEMLKYLNGDELDETDPSKLQELFALGSQLGYNALMDEVAAKLAPNHHTTRSNTTIDFAHP